jgi:glyoxalase family protein
MSFAVPTGALGFWQEHLSFHEVRFSAPEERAYGRTLALYDPAGLLIELVETEDALQRPGRSTAQVPAEHALRGLLGVTLTVADLDKSATFLQEALGLNALQRDTQTARYHVGEGSAAGYVEVLGRPGMPRGHIAAGAVHHVAFRVADDAHQAEWSRELERKGVPVTEVRDRQYFRSIYFREPAGVIFEIATDVPGFLTDEPLETLGTTLQLPPWLETKRADIEWALPKLNA